MLYPSMSTPTSHISSSPAAASESASSPVRGSPISFTFFGKNGILRHTPTPTPPAPNADKSRVRELELELEGMRADMAALRAGQYFPPMPGWDPACYTPR
ncbi:hypothetical protein BJ508DRAFT_334499 [Ascobolus immersus RN42]|uniref:Uncharacterized protein n=1 Tax=Ascobolus immersus RN42 TaxID=1160509 RepID=A0A3N4HFV4_ASCIM|nr:hypothetical protein BJ508DRAFT_334499 [Ascobolus immersus RN42]